MPDREKVINNLILIIQSKITHLVDIGNGLIELQQLAIDALALLKEQETVAHALDILRANGWEEMRYPSGTIGKWEETPDVVLCGVCKHGHLVGSGFCECKKNGGAHYHDWYCGDGERRNKK